MTESIQVRTVTVELLRPGPAHNQLLSPLTQYLAICDDSEAGIVTQPYEHETFLRRMGALGYERDGWKSERVPMLREMGAEMGKILGTIPRLPGALTADADGPDTLIHLRLVLSASELAALPFELAKMPLGPGAVADSWLSLQVRTPVVMTRRTRNVSTHGVKWPMQPRVLFVSADPEADAVPFDAHRQALLDAVRPFCYPGRDDAVVSDGGRREQLGTRLTILKSARFEEVVTECAAHRYTHVHFLAHGVKDESQEHTAYGLQLDGNVITADRLASALTGLVDGAIQRPTVVTLATCDSGKVSSVMVPGASIAHVLHQAGIPLVVASQVPLSKEGSVLVFREFYGRLLWGDNPWPLLHRVRTALHGRLAAKAHDWASVVVYEALPPDLAEQLEEARYNQGKAAINAAFEAIERAVAQADVYQALRRDLVGLLEQLPMDGRFAMECLGLRASTHKRLAQAEYRIAVDVKDDPVRQNQHLEQSWFHLDEALHAYEQAVTGFFVNLGRPIQRIATMHWVLVQQLSLATVLCRRVPEGTREAAYLSARAYLDHPQPMEQAWAHGSLAELHLLELARLDRPETFKPEEAIREARRHAKELVRLARRCGQPFAIESTRKQFERYIGWWGTPLFEQAAMEREICAETRQAQAASSAESRCSSTAPAGHESMWQMGGLVDAAASLAAILHERSAAVAGERPIGSARSDIASPAGQRAANAALVPSTPSPAPASAPLTVPSPPAGQSVLGAAAARSAPRAAKPAARGQPFLRVEMLAAGHGDCLWIEYGDRRRRSRVLVDCGTASTYAKVLKPRLEQLPPDQRAFELLILSHVDDDHIGGAIPMLKALNSLGLRFGDVWFNGWKHMKAFAGFLGARQGEQFSQLIEENDLAWNAWRQQGPVVLPRAGALPTCTLPGGMQLTLLSPSEEKLAELAPEWKKTIEAMHKKPGDDDFLSGGAVGRETESTDVKALAEAPFAPDGAEANGSSIAVLAEYAGKRVLLGADAHAPLLVESIARLVGAGATLKLDAFKLPHHGSQNNLNIELMQRLACGNYLVSSDGSRFRHPDRQSIARVIHLGGNKPRLHFNYESGCNRVWKSAELQQQYGYETIYPERPDKPGLVVEL